MSNEEKTREILDCENCKKQLFLVGSKCPPTCADYNDLMKMAQWKDEQFVNFLEWIDNVYVLRRFSDGESIDFKGLVEKFKLMQK